MRCSSTALLRQPVLKSCADRCFHGKSFQNRALRAGSRERVASMAAVAEGLPPGFSDSKAKQFVLGVLGDLHLEPAQAARFAKGAQQVAEAIGCNSEVPGCSRVVQLGDLGGYDDRPGSQHCFDNSRNFMRRIPVPWALITGNHDLEGQDFDTDEANLAAWTQTFGQRHYWAAELGPVVCVGLSTVRFRSNTFSAHEVYIDEQQLAWLEELLASIRDRPVFMFTHCPPLGCGLKAVMEVHVRNRCAWINQSSGNARDLLQLVHRYPNIRLWFSGHYHLSHNYADSISVVNKTAFVQVGVMGNSHRDGFRHSRVIKGDEAGFRMYTLDHGGGDMRLDLEHSWSSAEPPQPSSVPEDVLLCEPEDEEDSRWPYQLFNDDKDASSTCGNGTVQDGKPARWWRVGKDCVLRRRGSTLIEYDAVVRAPMGVVFMHIGESERVVLVNAEGDDVTSVPWPDSDVVEVQLQAGRGHVSRSATRNESGTFYQIFQHNKWQARLRQRQREAVAS